MGGDIRSLADYRRKVAGAKAKAYGNEFEAIFLKACRTVCVACTRFPDGCKQIGGRELIRIKTPFDWIVTHQGSTALIDTKTSEEMTFSHSKITGHQINEMTQHERAGGIAGYVIWLRQSNAIVYVSAMELEKMARHPGSIRQGQENVRLLGTPSFFDVRLIFPKTVQGPTTYAG